ncbi:MAG: GTPase HflX [Paracoccaceae bacterium]|nr:GTPase HflX [Paracoccaceae bacterium]
MLTGVIRPVIVSKSKLISAETQLEDGLLEAIRLAKALPDVIVKIKSIIKLRKPNASTFFGTGNVKSFKKNIAEKKISLVLVDGTLTAIQQRNLEKEWKTKVLDRTGLILEIFGARAMSREGGLQVELAHLMYQRSRLVRSWTHLERQRGGMGFLGGPGETQIEADKRAINARINQIKKALVKVVKTRKLHRSKRKKIPYPTVALVGYTNSGKSSIFNRLTGADTLVKDMLFATLDTKMKGLKLSSGQKLIVSDTVGFISDLPTLLVAAFKATLEEVTTADLILHVRDMSSFSFKEQGKAVESVLKNLGIEKDAKPIIEVWNKADKLSESECGTLNFAAITNEKQKVTVSAKTGVGFENLRELLKISLNDEKKQEEIFVSFKKSKSRSWLFENDLIIREEVALGGFKIFVSWTEIQRNRFFSSSV